MSDCLLAKAFGVGCSALDVCFRPTFGNILHPDEPPDRCPSSALRARGAAHDAGDFDAAAKERRLGRGIWRGGHGKYFWRTNHKRAGEVHGLDGWRFFCADLCLIDPLCPQEHGGRQRISARADEDASGAANFSSPESWRSTVAQFLSSPGFRCRGLTCRRRNAGGLSGVAWPGGCSLGECINGAIGFANCNRARKRDAVSCSCRLSRWYQAPKPIQQSSSARAARVIASWSTRAPALMPAN
jgi:hypothetical protein